MNKKAIYVLAILSVGIGLIIVFLVKKHGLNQTQKANLENKTFDKNQANMNLSSEAFADGGEIPVKYSCRGDNENPPLTFSKVPDKTASLALILEDPDAPDATFTHWLVWNITPDLRVIKENIGNYDFIQGKNDSGKVGYFGPCPSRGTHRYIFTLYALDETVNLKGGETKKNLLKAMENHILDRASLTGTFRAL